MRFPSQKGILVLLLAIFLVVSVPVITNLISDDVKAWCLNTFGEGYTRYLYVPFVLGCVAMLFLTTDFSKWLKLGSASSTPQRYNIPPGPKSRKVLDQAKAEVGNAEPGEALRLLSDLKLPTLSNEINLLAARLADYQRTRRLNVEAHDTENRAFNRINRDILALISVLQSELSTSTGNYDTIREYLKKRYTNRLEQKLAKRQPVNLRRIPSTEGTSKERVSTFVAYNSQEIGGTMADIFLEGRGRLLLLGAPGAGKTTLMIQLVLELIHSEPDSMPVLLNLATWNKDFITLETWLKKILPAELGVSERLASEIIQQNRLILLFDGFDEIKEDERESCIEAIKRYSEDDTRQYAISSRIEEYKQIAKDAPVESQIEVGPLSLAQLEAELQRLWSDPVKPERGARLLWNAIQDQENELLRKVVETPVFFNSLQILFSGSNTWAELQIKADSVEEIQSQITARFVQYELDGAREKYPPEMSSHWLSFFSSRMKERNMVVFELIDLQYDWWKWNRWGKIQANLVFGLVVGLFFGLLGGLVYGLVFVLVGSLFYSLVGSPVYSLFYSLVGVLVGSLFFVLAVGLFLSLVVGLVVGLVGVLRNRSVDIYTKEVIKWSWKNYFKSIFGNLKRVLLYVLVSSMLFGPVGGLGGVLVVGLVDLMTNVLTITQITSPYHRFNASMRALRFSILQHKHLCYLLRKRNLLPPDLPQFLNEMSLRHIMEFDGDPKTGTGGGSWRFRHRILQEYFAERWVEEENAGGGKPKASANGRTKPNLKKP